LVPPLEIRISEGDLREFLENSGFFFEKSCHIDPYSYLAIFSFKE